MSRRDLAPVLAGVSTGASIGVIGYVWAGYPLLISALARLRPVAEVTDPAWVLPTVTVVVAALDEEAVIADKVTELLECDYPPELLDVVVVCDGSGDRTAAHAAAAGPGRCRVIDDGARAGKSAAVNRGVAASVADIIVLSDANNHYDVGTVGRLVAPFADPTVAATVGAKRVVGGAAEVTVGEGAYWRYESTIKTAESRAGSCTAASGEVMAVRRDVVAELPPGVINDDFFLILGALRSGGRVVYVPDACSVETSSATSADERSRRTRMAAGRFEAVSRGRSLLPDDHQLRWQIISHKYLRLALPWAFLGGLFGSMGWVATGGRRLARVVCAGQIGFHAASVIGHCWRPAGRVGRLLSVPAYLLDVNVAIARGFVAWRRGTYRHGWERVRRAGEPQVDGTDAAVAA